MRGTTERVVDIIWQTKQDFVGAVVETETASRVSDWAVIPLTEANKVSALAEETVRLCNEAINENIHIHLICVTPLNTYMHVKIKVVSHKTLPQSSQ